MIFKSQFGDLYFINKIGVIMEKINKYINKILIISIILIPILIAIILGYALFGKIYVNVNEQNIEQIKEWLSRRKNCYR